MQAARLTIFCDGGIGNRINALVSGLAIAHHYGLSYYIHWPENNWCAASFSDIFNNQHPTSRTSIKDLHNQYGDAVVLLHDEIASTALNVTFNSAYGYESLEDFDAKVLSSQKNIFYYPAIFPEWIPIDLIHKEISHLVFSDFITHEVKQFITQAINKPFYGLHLRRTDLNVGLTDHEVLSLVTQHKDKDFFVCSDDPLAETLASVHPNVHRREKAAHVEKKNSDQGWLAQCKDDDERTYFGNISRSKDSVIEGTIDMLILAHSEIIGYSGSTFQRMARLLGEFNPMVPIEKPMSLQFVSANELSRQINQRLITIDFLVQICNSLASQGSANEGLTHLQHYLETLNIEESPRILLDVSIYCLNYKRTNLAIIYLKAFLHEQPNNYFAWLHLSFAYLISNQQIKANYAFNNFLKFAPEKKSQDEANLATLICKKLKIIQNQ